MVLFNQSIYHRHIAKKIEKLDALWFQISDKKNGTNERILIEISFIQNDLKILNFLGSGQKTLVLAIQIQKYINCLSINLLRSV